MKSHVFKFSERRRKKGPVLSYPQASCDHVLLKYESDSSDCKSRAQAEEIREEPA